MAERSPIQPRLARLSGRVAAPTGWVAPEGTRVMVLGSDEPGWTGRFGSNDTVRVKQFGSRAQPNVVAVARARIVTRSAPENGGSWFVTAYNADGTVWFLGAYSFPFPPNVTIDMDDLAIPLLDADVPTEGDIGYALGITGHDEDEDIEIPAFYIDSITVDPIPNGVDVFNRYPASGMVDAPRDSMVFFYVISTLGVGNVAPADVNVWFNGVQVVTAGVGEPGYNAQVVNINSGTTIVAVIPPAPFGSQETIEVRATASLSTSSFDRSWSFTTVDETAPQLIAASAPDHEHVRVGFNEPMTMVDPTASNDALNPANWTVTPKTTPAVTVEVVGVTQVTSFEVLLELDIPMTQGATYEVVAADMEDVHGNEIAAPYDRMTFSGYACAVPEGRRFQLWRMLADIDRRRDTTGDLEKFVGVLQEPTDLLLCDIDRWTDILDVDIAPERYVDQMLITLGNPFDFDLELIDKRRLVRSLVRVYQQKGTDVGIINVIRFFLGLEVTIGMYNEDCWILGEDELGVGTILASSDSFARYSFVVIATQVLTQEQRDRIDDLVEYMKPPHTHHIKTIEPTIPEVIDHLELGLSELGSDDAPWMLH